MKYNGSTSLLRIFALFAAIFTIIGLLMGVVGFLLINGDLSSSKTAISLPTVIENISGDKVYVTYEFNGDLYTNIPLNFFYSEWEEGQSFMVKIDPENPGKPLPLNTTIFVLPPLIIGGAFLIFGIGFFVALLHLFKTQKQLYEGNAGK